MGLSAIADKIKIPSCTLRLGAGMQTVFPKRIYILVPDMKNFKVEAEGAEFEFITMHAREVKLFQVYVMYEGKRRRFHMQLNQEGNFVITDPEHCPQEYLKAEELLSKAINIYGRDGRPVE